MQNEERKELWSGHLSELSERVDELSTGDCNLPWQTDHKQKHRAHVQFLVSLMSIMTSLLGTVLAALGVSASSSTLPQIPKPYFYFVAVVVSSLAGISIIFFFVWKIYQQGKRERIAAIEGVRAKEKQFFANLESDFKSMLKAHNLDARLTIRDH